MERHSNEVRPHEERHVDMPQEAVGQTPPTDGQRYGTPIRAKKRKKSWYNQGWLWLIIAIVGIAVLSFSLSGLTQQAAEINDSIKKQTGVLSSINHILSGIRNGIDTIASNISEGFDRVIALIRELMDKLGIG